MLTLLEVDWNEESGNVLGLFASDLKLPPGQSPDRISTIIKGSRCLFSKDSTIWHYGEFGGYRYVSIDTNKTIHIFND